MNTVDTINVNGINYTINGGGTGTVSGTFNFTGMVISKEFLGYKSAYIDAESLVDQLRQSGVDVDAPNFLNENEDAITIAICTDYNFNMLSIYLSKYEYGWDLTYQILNGIQNEVDFISEPTDSLKDILLKVENYINKQPFNLPSIGDISNTDFSNMIILKYGAINEYQFFNISNVNEFCKKVFIEYNSGSDSSSSI